MSADLRSFPDNFSLLTGHSPMRWQHRLFDRLVKGDFPSALDLPTGLGKTSVMAIWLIARALAGEDAIKAIPRRLVYIVDRRAVVDQATEEASKLRKALDGDARHLKELIGLGSDSLPISTLRGAHVDNREWLADPAVPAIVVGTIDMIGSRLLFEGYGVSRKMRPYHAGLLGADTLLVLDEAHLVPPFLALLHAVEGDAALRPHDRAPLPRFVVLPLSATQRGRATEGRDRKPFGLEEEDWRDDKVSPRLNDRKHLRIEPPAGKDHDERLAEAALKLATEGGPARMLVFCNRREKKDDGAGPSAQGVAEAIVEKARREKIDIEPPELLVGARRVRERERVAQRLRELGFIDGTAPPKKPAFLVATSAGEVGVDLDADHMVSDLAPWERMVQRLGRVNRRGGEGRAAQILVFDTSELEKDEARKAPLTATRDLFKRIETEFEGRAGPAVLRELSNRVGWDAIETASTPEPLHPALTRPLVDAWSMTSLEHHTGRPDVAPWLRGWTEPDRQTTVLWRSYLPVREDDAASHRAAAPKKDVEAFFEAAPPHQSEKLETDTYRVIAWLQGRAKAFKRKRNDPGGNVESPGPETAKTEEGVTEDAETDDVDAQPAMSQTRALRPDDVVAYALLPDGSYAAGYTLGDLARERKGKEREELLGQLIGKTLILDAGLGGLKAGMLDNTGESGLQTADEGGAWSTEAGFRVRRATSDNRERNEENWHFEDDFVLRRDSEGKALEWLVVEHFRDAAQSEDARSVSRRPQGLDQHQGCAEERAREIARKIGLSGAAAEALALAARLHDEGKRASRWQRAFKAARDEGKYGLAGPLAKTRGPIDHAILDGYRHEFGSLPYAEAHAGFRAFPEEWHDLILHLIAAHHGQARPVIGTRGCEDPPSALEARARAVALRFARLQKRWGPWGLAWWEALLRAADQQASRDNDTGQGLGASRGEGK